MGITLDFSGAAPFTVDAPHEIYTRMVFPNVACDAGWSYDPTTGLITPPCGWIVFFGQINIIAGAGGWNPTYLTKVRKINTLVPYTTVPLDCRTGIGNATGQAGTAIAPIRTRDLCVSGDAYDIALYASGNQGLATPPAALPGFTAIDVNPAHSWAAGF